MTTIDDSDPNNQLGLNNDPMSYEELNDKGPWAVSEDGRYIESDDFNHDVTLKVSGDFFSDEQRKAYAENLAKKLNRDQLMTSAERQYMDRIARLPCILGITLGEDHGPVHVHHIREGQGMSQRASNFLTIPLCPDCHQGPHGIHGDMTLLRIAKVDELDLLAMTIEMISEGKQ